MTTSRPPLLAVLACAVLHLAVCMRADAAQDVAPELRDLVPDLVAIDRMRAGTNRHVVSDARVAELERLLGEYLGLPPALRVRLTTTAGHRREVAKRGLVTMWVIDRRSGVLGGPSGLRGPWTATWSGECVYSGTLRFLRAAEPGQKDCSVHGGTHYPRSVLPRLFEGLSEVVEVAAAARHPVEAIVPGPGSIRVSPPFATARVHMRVAHPPGEVSLSALVRLPLGERDAEADGPQAAVGPRADVHALGPLLETGLKLVERIELSFPHSIQLSPEPADPTVFALTLAPYDRAHPDMPLRARLHHGGGPDGKWTVADWGGRLPFGAVDLDSFLAISNLVARITIDRDRRIGAFGLARGEAEGEVVACLVTIEEETIWAAKQGVLHLLRCGARGAQVALEVELPALEYPPGTGITRVVTTARGDFRLEIQDSEIFTRHPKQPVLRYADRDFALMGGHGMD